MFHAGLVHFLNACSVQIPHLCRGLISDGQYLISPKTPSLSERRPDFYAVSTNAVQVPNKVSSPQVSIKKKIDHDSEELLISVVANRAKFSQHQRKSATTSSSRRQRTDCFHPAMRIARNQSVAGCDGFLV